MGAGQAFAWMKQMGCRRVRYRGRRRNERNFALNLIAYKLETQPVSLNRPDESADGLRITQREPLPGN